MGPELFQRLPQNSAGVQLLCLNVMPFRRSGIGVAKNWGGNTDMLWVFDGNAGHGAIPKQVRIDWATKGALGHFGYAIVDRLAQHRLTVLVDPKMIAAGAIEQYRPNLIHVVIDVRRKSFRHRNFYGLTGLHLEPLKPQLKAPLKLEQMPTNHNPGKIAKPHCGAGDQQAHKQRIPKLRFGETCRG